MLSAAKMNLFVLVLGWRKCCACRKKMFIQSECLFYGMLSRKKTERERMKRERKQTGGRKKCLRKHFCTEPCQTRQALAVICCETRRVLSSDSCVSYWICAAEVQWAAAFTFWLKGILFLHFSITVLAALRQSRAPPARSSLPSPACCEAGIKESVLQTLNERCHAECFPRHHANGEKRLIWCCPTV